MMSVTCGERAVGKKRIRKGFNGSFGATFSRLSKRVLTGKPVIFIFSLGRLLVISSSRV